MNASVEAKYQAGVCAVEDEIAACQQDLARSRDSYRIVNHSSFPFVGPIGRWNATEQTGVPSAEQYGRDEAKRMRNTVDDQRAKGELELEIR